MVLNSATSAHVYFSRSTYPIRRSIDILESFQQDVNCEYTFTVLTSSKYSLKMSAKRKKKFNSSDSVGMHSKCLVIPKFERISKHQNRLSYMHDVCSISSCQIRCTSDIRRPRSMYCILEICLQSRTLMRDLCC